jgi:pyruvate/2-oxoglutarate dehydrogenase complex dihydrolipoamide acyltransferase (E2) component
MFHRTLIRFSRRITLPQLSPTHSQGRIVKFTVREGDSVQAYDPVVVVECSPDLMTEAFRESNANPYMIIDTQDEGIVKDLKLFYIDTWVPVGTTIGVIEDEDPVDGDWTWQAYIHNDNDAVEQGNGISSK